LSLTLAESATIPPNIATASPSTTTLRSPASTPHIDPQRIGIWGFSVGTVLAALAGLTDNQAEIEGQSGSSGYSNRVQAIG
jgi:acetyl esterase/lipase